MPCRIESKSQNHAEGMLNPSHAIITKESILRHIPAFVTAFHGEFSISGSSRELVCRVFYLNHFISCNKMFDFTSFPNLSTRRLKLRCLATTDTDDIFAVRSDYEVTKYNSGAAYTDASQALNLIERSLSGFQSKSSVYWAITVDGSDTVVGQAGFNCWDQDNNSAEVGFDLRRDHWRQGIMTEALAAILWFGFTEMGLNRVGA